MRPALKLLDGATATNGKPANTAATGSITAAAGNTIVDGSAFVLGDGIGPAIQFVFDASSAVVPSKTKKAIAYTTGDNAATIKAAIIAAINAVTTDLRVTATDGGGVIVTLTNDFGGFHGNVSIANSTTLTITGMTGGITVGFPLNGSVPGTAWHWPLIDTGVLLLKSVAGSGTMDVTVRIWLYSELTHAWHPAGVNATITLRGILNDGTAITEDGADVLTHTEPINYLSGYEYIYAEVTVEDGTGTSVDLFLNSCAKQVAV